MFRPALTAFRRSIAASMGEFNLAGRTFEDALADAREMRDKWSEAYIYWRRAETDLVKRKPDRDHVLSDYAQAERAVHGDGGSTEPGAPVARLGQGTARLGMADEGAEKLRRSWRCSRSWPSSARPPRCREELAAA